MDLGLRGKRALVGGASKGLGLACVQALAAEGCEVAMVSRSEGNLAAAARTLPAGARVLAIPADLSTVRGRDECFARAEAWGPVDILVNNTGGPPPGGSLAHDDATWQKAYDALLLYVRKACERFLPGMRARRWGRIVTITSVTVKEPVPHLALSNVFRAGLTAYLKILAREVAADGVTVNTVLPGAFLTSRYEELLDAAAARTGRTREQAAADVVATLPQGRFQRPAELGAVVAFLASDLASGVNGAALPVDGGKLLGLLS